MALYVGKNKVKVINDDEIKKVAVEKPYDLYMWLDGTSDLTSNNWVDKVNNFQWTASNEVSHDGTNYYSILNPTSGYSNVRYLYISGGGSTINLGKRWKVVADVEIANNTLNGYIMDLCSYGTVANGKNGLGLSFNTTHGARMNIKINGNNVVTVNNVSDVTIPLNESWNRMKLTWKCEPVSETQSKISGYVNDTLCSYSNNFNTIVWEDFRTTSSPYDNVFIGRGFLNTSSNHQPLRFKLYDLKIYKEIDSLTDKPYDSEVGYIETNKKAYINTEIKPTNTTRFLIEMMFPTIDGSIWFFGSRKALGDSQLAIFYNGSNNFWDWRFGSKAKTIDSAFPTAGYYTFDNYTSGAPRQLYINNITLTADANTFTSTYPLYLFTMNNGGSAVTGQIKEGAKLIRAKIYDNNSLIADFIPVRVGQIGCLYNKINEKLYVNSGRGNLIPGKYDSEVDYLFNSGATQYIDTGVIYDSTVKIEMKLKMSGTTAGYYIFGIYTNTTGTAYRWALNGGTTTTIEPHFGTVTNVSANFSRDVFHIITADYRYLTVDGISTDTNASAFTPESDLNIILFARNDDGVISAFREAYIGYVKIWKNNTLIRDYIPVRKGTVGYLYDRINDSLYGNDGTGDFTIGQDKNSIYDAEIEYLESDGYAYIDSGIECTGDLKVLFDGLVTTNVNKACCGGIYIPDSGSTYFRHHWSPNGSSFYWIQYNSSSNASITTSISTNTWYRVVIDPANGTGTVAGTSKTFTALSASRTTGKNYFIFARKASDDSILSRPCRFKAFKMWRNGILLRNYIPVRKNGIGYFYDKVTNVLYGSVGSGNFTLGQDL